MVRLQLGALLAISFSESTSAIFLIPNSNLQYFGKTVEEGNLQIIITPVCFLFHANSLSYRMCYTSILRAVSAVPAGLCYAVVRSILPIPTRCAGNILSILAQTQYVFIILK